MAKESDNAETAESGGPALVPLAGEDEEPKGILDVFLSLFAEVKGGEGATALILLMNVLLLLVAYYVLKTVREPLIIGSGGAELKGYATAAQAVLLTGFIPAYAVVAKRLGRMQLVTATLLFYAASFALFWVLAKIGVPYLGFAFFLFLGIFSLSVIAQFWSMANDLYTAEQGKRLFAILGVGASVGAVAGSYLASKLIKPLGVFPMMLVAAGILLVCLGLSWLANKREAARAARRKVKTVEEPIGGQDGFRLLLQDRYLLLIAVLILLLNLVNTTGELILDDKLTEVARDQLAPGVPVREFIDSLDSDPSLKKQTEDFIGEWRGNFFTWVNAIGAVTQLFLVSRIFKYLGVRVALFALPVIGLFAYGVMAFFPILSLIRIGKIAENACDYSLYNTTKHALWLQTTREQKYNAKMATDTFVVRAGDLVSGLAIGVGIHAYGGQAFAFVNLGLIAIWLVVAYFLGRANARREQAAAAPQPA